MPSAVIRADSATGAPYSGRVRFSLISDAVRVAAPFPGGWTGIVRCDLIDMEGLVEADGRHSITRADWGDTTTPDGTSATNFGAYAAMTQLDLPYEGEIIHDPVRGGRDGTLVWCGVLMGVLTQAPGLARTCAFAPDNFDRSWRSDFFNADNPNRPAPDVDGAQVRIDGAHAVRVNEPTPSQHGCPPWARMTAVLEVRGENPDSPGVWDRTLHITS